MRTALDISFTEDVEVKAEDTDILCLLVHHCRIAQHNMYLTTSKGTYSINEISSKLNKKQQDTLLFSHSFSGCDTVSGVYGFGKVAIFNKMTGNKCPDDALQKITSLGSSKVDIIHAGITLFQYIYGNKDVPLHQQRYQSFGKMAAKGAVTLSRLPPTAAAAREHFLRAYLQYRDWLLLESQSLDPIDYGWRREMVGYLNQYLQQSLWQQILS